MCLLQLLLLLHSSRV